MASSAIYIIAIIATEIAVVGIGYAMVNMVRHSSAAAGRANQLQALLDVLDECVVISSGLQIVASNESLSRRRFSGERSPLPGGQQSVDVKDG